MRVSAKSEYACLAMLALASQEEDGAPLRIRDISEENEIPERYLLQILSRLKNAGLVASRRGSLGGYRLTRKPSSITIADVLDAMDGPDSPSQGSRNPSAIALAAVWENVRDAERSVLDQTSIAQVAQRIRADEWVI